jgi:hypothetical protein
MAGSSEYNDKKGCPPGFHKSYSHKHHSTRCVKSQTRKNFSPSSTKKLHCPKGHIPRHGYIRRFGKTIMKKGYTVRRAEGKEYRIYPEKKSVYVKASCVKDVGNSHMKASPGNRGVLRKGELKKHGYIYNESISDRHEALKKAIKEFGTLDVYNKLDTIAKLSKFSVPEASKIFKEDRDWIKNTFELKQ